VTYLNGQTPWHYPITDADVEPGTPETLDKSANALPIGDILAAAAPPPDGPPPSR
jgi:hypothetical protein